MTFVNRAVDLSVHNPEQQGLPLLSLKKPGQDDPARPDLLAFHELSACVTTEDRAFWCMMRPGLRPSFTPALLAELRRMQLLAVRLSEVPAADGRRPFDHVVLGSDTPGVFSLGGDLALFVEKIRSRDADALRRYGYACCDVLHANHAGYGAGVISIGLVEGDALGGGWECAASCDVLVAERRARFGLPEILFNLFPGMGAYSFLARRVGPVKAEEMILSGRIYAAEELHAIGLVDVLAEDGGGRAAVKGWIAANRARRNARAAICAVRRRVDPVRLDELRDVVDIWVAAALELSEQDTRKMLRIAAAQDRLRLRGTGRGLPESPDVAPAIAPQALLRPWPEICIEA